MKKNLLIAVFALLACTGDVFAISHNLQDYGMVAQLNLIYDSAENPDNLAPMIKKYHERIQAGEYDIPYEDFVVLHEDVSAIVAQNSKHQL